MQIPQAPENTSDGPAQASSSKRAQEDQPKAGNDRKRNKRLHQTTLLKQEEENKAHIEIDDDENLEALQARLKEIKTKIRRKVKQEQPPPDCKGLERGIAETLRDANEVIDLTLD